MQSELLLLTGTSAAIALIHTVAGPDHYLPFIVMSKARDWSTRKTIWITVLCGLGHIGSSVVLGLIGVALGIAVASLQSVEAWRGNVAGWALIALGLVYFAWGMKRAIRNRPHSHLHVHSDGEPHAHDHIHATDHVHVHDSSSRKSITPWVLFSIFVFGPCEPLIPLVMYPAAKHSTIGLWLVTAVFGLITICSMVGIVLVSRAGLNLLPMGKLERFSHALAGATILLCGVAIQFLGL